MSQIESEPPAAAPSNRQAFERELKDELVRRIDELAISPEATLSPLSARDWVATVVLFLILPLALVWMFR